jgi:protoheme IX farnesyltransferase
MSALATLAELTKFRIAAVSTLSAATGYLAFRGAWTGLGSLVLGTLLLAMGASALNEVQEWRMDARMERTRSRPIPRGAVSAGAAAALAAILSGSGTVLLAAAHGRTPALLGLAALGWYNGLYTPLKRHSAFAVVPGSVIGALPPAMGWTAAGGSPGDPALLALCFVLFLWQVPHFWLLILLHGPSYERAGFPTLARHFHERQIRRLIFTWTCACVAACGLLPLFGTLTHGAGMLLLGAGCLWLVARFRRMLTPREGQFRQAFLDINLFALLLMAAVAGGALAEGRRLPQGLLSTSSGRWLR